MSVRQRVLHSAPLIAFALAIVFLGLSLGGYDPADPPGRGAEPVNQPPTNPCGPVGAVFAHVLFITLGWSSWLLLLGLAVVNLLVITPPPRPRPAWAGDRALGWSWSSPPASSTRSRRRSMPSPAVGSGGYVGRVGRDLPRSSLRTCRHAPDPGRRRAVRPGAVPRRALLLADPGDPRLAPPANGGASRRVHVPAHPPGSSLAVRRGTGDWESPGAFRRPRSRHRCRCTRRFR